MVEHPEVERGDPIAGDVRAIWRDSRQRYGARKIRAALARRGVTASRRRIGNIMRKGGMTSAYARRTFKPHKTGVNEAKLANLLDREFDGYEPRTHLASDLTYVRVGGGWAYVCLLIIWRTGASPAIPPVWPGTRTWCWARSPRSTSP